MADKDKIAALDLGSNSFHLVVARVVAADVQILHRLKLRVQLAEGLGEDVRLSDEAMARGLENLKILAESLNDFHPDQVRVVATYTLRKARNAGDFVRAAREILPYPVEVISGAEEARLIYLGVAHTTYHDGKRLVIDIGGGSTETIIGQDFDALMLKSLPMGCVTYTNRYFRGGHISADSFTRALNHARQEIEPISDLLVRLGWSHCLGSSGTVKAIVSLAESLGASRPGYITRDELALVTEHCIRAGNVDKLGDHGFSDQRRQVFPAGVAILTALFESLGIEVLEYSAGALREGVLYEMEERLENVDIRDRTAQSLVSRYVVDQEQAQRVRETTLMLYEQVKDDWQLADPGLRNMLMRAALLHEVGLQINSRNVHRHSGYILQHVDMPGFNLEEQHLLATLVRFQQKKIKKPEFNEFLQYAEPEVLHLIALLRLGVLLNFKRQKDVLPVISLEVDGNRMKLTFEPGWLAEKPVYRANLEREASQIKALGLKLSVS